MHCCAGSALLARPAGLAAAPEGSGRPPHLLQHLTLRTSTGRLCFKDCQTGLVPDVHLPVS